jgi:glucose-1-phosphate thymidylyltransferase
MIQPSPDGLAQAFILGRGYAWLDAGTMVVDATDFIRMIEKRQGVKIFAPEEIAFRKGWINKEQMLASAVMYGKSPYGEHLRKVVDGKLK